MITALCIKMTTSNNRHSEHTPQSPLRQSSRLSRQFIVRIMLASNWIVIVRRILLIYLWNLYVTLSFFSNMKTYTGCPQKNSGYFGRHPLKLLYHNFPVAQEGAEIFEFKVDPVPKTTFLNVMSGV